MAFSARVSDAPLAQINVTPLVDVLLVLLVIVMITSPALTHTLKLDLPHTGTVDMRPPPTTITLSLRADGSMRWNDVPVDDAMLDAQLAIAARRSDPPRLLLDPADGAPYATVARVMANAKRQGLNNIVLVDPR